MLLASDSQLKPFATSLGTVNFIQVVKIMHLDFTSLKVVGVTGDELEAAQQWSVHGVLDLLRRKPLYVMYKNVNNS